MKLAISGSRRTISSASRQMRDHTGSTVSMTLARCARCWVMNLLPPPHDGSTIARQSRRVIPRPGDALPELAEKAQDRGRKAVVAVARNHVPRTGHVHIFSMWDEVQELPHVRLAYQFRRGPAHQHRRDRDPPRRLDQ